MTNLIEGLNRLQKHAESKNDKELKIIVDQMQALFNGTQILVNDTYVPSFNSYDDRRQFNLRADSTSSLANAIQNIIINHFESRAPEGMGKAEKVIWARNAFHIYLNSLGVGDPRLNRRSFIRKEERVNLDRIIYLGADVSRHIHYIQIENYYNTTQERWDITNEFFNIRISRTGTFKDTLIRLSSQLQSSLDNVTLKNAAYSNTLFSSFVEYMRYLEDYKKLVDKYINEI